MQKTCSPVKRNMEEKQGDSSARPFQLRPSILSGSGFSSSFGSFGNAADKTSKEFTLRPSALTTAAGQLESIVKQKETRKRLHDDDDEGDPSNTDGADDEESSKKVKTSGGENNKSESPVKLTEDLQKPAGIGTFGFGDEEKMKANNGKSSETDESFQGPTNNDTNKNFFVFGNNSNATSVGFNTLKSEKAEEEENEVNRNNGVDETGATNDLDKEKLLENADEYQQSLGQKTHLQEVEQITGEEGERNVLQVFCKLHMFDKPKQVWVEKGRGTLKLNDRCHSEGIFQSRLVFRTQGTNIVLLNMMLWPEMCCERVKEKSVRITALDPTTKEAKVYLITTAIKDSLQTYIAIDRRIGALKRNKHNTDEQKERSSGDASDRENKFLPNIEDDDSSTESERISSRENSMYGPTDDSDHQTSPSPET